MLHACGGSGYKRDMELERYLRDGKAGWVMGPTNEVLRQFVGKAALLGLESLDYWNQIVNGRAIENETKKLDAEGKRELAEKLLAEAGGGRGQGADRTVISAVTVSRPRLDPAGAAARRTGPGAIPGAPRCRHRPGTRPRR